MSDEPDDLMDQRGRMNRIVVAIGVGVVCGVIAYFICDRLTARDAYDELIRSNVSRRNDGRFFIYMVGLAFAAGLSITLVVLNKLAAKRWRERQIPQATLKS